MKNLLVVAIVLVSIALGGWVVESLVGRMTEDNPPEYKGFVYSLDNFNTECIAGATETGEVSEADARAYCTCVYDKGVAEYGGEGWTQELIDYETTETFTPKVNQFINECAGTLR